MNDTRQPAYEIVSDEELAQEARSFPGRTYTPGPWLNIADGAERSILAHGHHTIIATVHDLLPNDQVTANARLIAASPDLLAALEALLCDCHGDGYECYLHGNDATRESIDTGSYPERQADMRAAYAAIAQAKGEA